jgi:hypothetical protein
MKISNKAIYSSENSNSEGLIKRQYFHYAVYLYPKNSVKTPLLILIIRTFIYYSILIESAYLNVIIEYIHFICCLKFSLQRQYGLSNNGINLIQHSISKGVIKRQ